MAKISGQNSRTNSIQQKRTGSVSSGPGTPQNRFDPKLKHKLMDEQNEKIAKADRDVAEAREKAMASYKQTSNIVMPQYRRDELLCIDREFDCPPETLFMGLGWDEDSETKRRHYRRYYPDELENITEIMGERKSPFNSYDLKRG